MIRLAGQRLAGQLADDPAFGHDEHPVAQVRQFLGLGGYDEHRHALARKVADQTMNFGACADVDAARRFVENEHFGPRRQPSGDDHLLLVAAAQSSDRRFGAGRLDREVANGAVGERLSAAAADEGRRSMEDDRLEIGEAQVEGDALGQDQPLDPPLLRHEADPSLDGVRRTARRVGLAFERHRALLRAVDAKQEPSQLGPACADEAAKSKDFALPQIEAHAFDPWRAGEGAYGKSRLAGGSSVRPLRRRIDDAADDRLDHRLSRQVRAGQLRHRSAVAKHRHASAEFENFIEPMRHIEHRHARSPKVADDAEQPLGLRGGQRGGRLVHHDEPRLAHQRAGDVDEPILRRRQALGVCAKRRPHADPRRDRSDIPGDRPPVDDAEARLFRHAEHDVLEHRHAGDERQLLMDEAHAELVRGMRTVGDDPLAVDENVAVVRLRQAGENPDERRLARAVGANEAVHLAWKDRQRDAAQRLSAAVALADRSYRDKRRRLRRLRATCRNRSCHSLAGDHFRAAG